MVFVWCIAFHILVLKSARLSEPSPTPGLAYFIIGILTITRFALLLSGNRTPIKPFRKYTTFALSNFNCSVMDDDLKWVVEELSTEVRQLKETIENLQLLIADLTKALKK